MRRSFHCCAPHLRTVERMHNHAPAAEESVVYLPQIRFGTLSRGIKPCAFAPRVIANAQKQRKIVAELVSTVCWDVRGPAERSDPVEVAIGSKDNACEGSTALSTACKAMQHGFLASGSDFEDYARVRGAATGGSPVVPSLFAPLA